MSSINARVPPSRIAAIDSPADGEVAAYQASSGQFEWVANSGGGGGGGTVTSVALTGSGTALTITGSPITGAGTFNIAGAGTSSQVILGDLSLGTLTSGTIGGSIANTQVAVGSGADTISGSASFTYSSNVLDVSNQIELSDVGAAGILKNSESNQDLRLQVTGTGTIRAENQTTNTDSQFQVKGNGTGLAKLILSNDTKAVTLQCDENQKIKVDGGGGSSFVFDASSATGGITFPDGTTQITAATGGGSISFPIEADSGSSGAPSYAFSADTDTGIYLSGASNMGIAAGGQNYLFIGSLGSVQFNKKALFNAATAAAPNGFATDTNTGFFQPSADTIGFSTAGTERLRFGSSGEILVGGTASGTSGEVLTSGGSGAAVSWTTPSGGGAKPAIATSMDSAYDMYMLTSLPPYTRNVLSSSSNTITTSPFFIPFVAPKNITGVALEISVTTAGASSNLKMCLYESSTSTGNPTTKVTNSDLTIDATSTGYKTGTFSSSVALTNNLVYWVGLCSDNANITVRTHASDNAPAMCLLGGLSAFNKSILKDNVATTSLPASITDANLEPSYSLTPMVGLQI